MYNIQRVNNNFNKVNYGSNFHKKNNIVSFKQNRPMTDFEKERKEAKKRNNFSLGISLVSTALFAVMVGVLLFGKNGLNSLRSKTEQDALHLKPRDLKKIKERPRDSYSKEVQDFIDRFESLLKREDIEAKGGKRIAQVQLAGPGGTGKTDVAGVMAKKVEELFPGSEYYIPDLSMLSSSSYKGQDVQMLTEYTQAISKRASELANESSIGGKKKYLVCFLDEFDKIAMENNSINKADSNKTIGALKTLINSLMEHDNVILLSATNYPELIEDAVSSRVAEKVMVDYLNPKQIKTAIVNHYQDCAKKELISPELLDLDNRKLNEICDILGKRNHEMEYRKLFNNIIPNTLTKSPENKPIEIKHLAEAVTSPSIARELKLTQAEINQLKRLTA